MAQSDLARSVAKLPTKAAKVRALAAKGHPRAAIARALGIRYQQVRNVLVRDEAKAAKATEAAAAAAVTSAPSASRAKIRVESDGRIVVPAALGEALGVKAGDVVFAQVHDGEIHLLTATAMMRRVQALVRQFVPQGVSLVDELLEDRRHEVEAERDHG